MGRRNCRDASLRPPSHDHHPRDEAGAPITCVTLDVRAYIADRRNATTAYGRMSDGGEIQVTFFAAPPPVTSYFCVWCPETRDLAGLATEPRIIAAEADLAVLSVGLGSGFQCYDPRWNDIFIYYAGAGEKGPWLRRLTREDSYFFYYNIGLLRHGDGVPDDDDHYHVVTVSPTRVAWQFNLHLFDSKTETWSCRDLFRWVENTSTANLSIVCPRPSCSEKRVRWGLLTPGAVSSSAMCLMVTPCCITCHYHGHSGKTRSRISTRNPDVARDVVVVNGRVKVAECFCDSAYRWKASIWSRSSTSLDLEEENWQRDYKVDICDNLLVDNDTLHFELLPKLQGNDGTPLQALDSLHISHPRLSVNNDDIIYLMAKVRAWDKRACVLAVDMRNKRLQDVGVFRADRSPHDTLCYINSRISKYFVSKQGMAGDLKRLGNFLMPYPRKKLAVPIINNVQQDTESSTGAI